MDPGRNFLPVERGLVGREAQAALLRLGFRPAPIRGADVLTRLPPPHVALEEPVDQRRTPLRSAVHPDSSFGAASRPGSTVALPARPRNGERPVTGDADLGRPSGPSHAMQVGCSTCDLAAYCRIPQRTHSSIGT